MTHERLYSVGTRIKEIRESKGMTATDLANKVGVAKQTVWKWERDITKRPPLNTIQVVAEALDVSPQYLAGWSTSMERTPDLIPVVKGENLDSDIL